MSDESPRPPNLNGCKVAVFRNDAVSGATIGYHGTVVRQWRPGTYLVSLPALHLVIPVEARDLLLFQTSAEGSRLVIVDGRDAWYPGEWRVVFGDDPDTWHVAERRWEIVFDSQPDADNAVVTGKYRIGSVEKGRFEFEKGKLPAPTYLFRMPAKTLGSSRGKLKFMVPGGRVLDRAYVMEALAAVLAQELPSVDEGATAGS